MAPTFRLCSTIYPADDGTLSETFVVAPFASGPPLEDEAAPSFLEELILPWSGFGAATALSGTAYAYSS